MAQVAQGQGRRTILFVDEVHRFNKAQQDAFLPYVESGLFTFIGATTENPSFEVNSALLSRARVYVLQSLTPEELQLLVDRAIAAFNDGLEAGAAMRVEPDAREQLAAWADGDARRLISAVEVVADRPRPPGATAWTRPGWKSRCRRTCGVSTRAATLSRPDQRLAQGGARLNPDAALYWFCRMIDGGADPKYLSRRLVRMAVEDIGLADPRATDLAVNGADIYERLGSPEGELALAQAVATGLRRQVECAAMNADAQPRPASSRPRPQPPCPSTAGREAGADRWKRGLAATRRDDRIRKSRPRPNRWPSRSASSRPRARTPAPSWLSPRPCRCA